MFSPNCSIIYSVGTVYCCPGHPSNTISSGEIKYYASFQNVTYEPLEYAGPIIGWSTTLLTGFRLYPTSDTEYYQLMRLHDFVVK